MKHHNTHAKPSGKVDDRRPWWRKFDGRYGPWVAFSAIVGLIIARAPVLFSEPRFWAEEGRIHYVYARSHDWLHSLLFVPIHGGPAGYFNLVPNLAMWLATRFANVESAPLVSTLIALTVQVIPLAIVVWGSSFLWSTLPQRFLAGLLLTLAPCVVGDVWLNTINSQVFLGLATLLILCERLENVSRRRRIVYRGLLALAGLTGVYSAALAPAAILRAIWYRKREARIQALLVSLAAILQAATYFLSETAFGLKRRRFDIIDWARTAAFATYHSILRPILGDDLGAPVSAALGLQEALGGPNLWRPARHLAEIPPTYAPWVVGLSLMVVTGLLMFLGRPRHLGQKVLLAALFSLWLIILPSTAPALPRLRYAVLPGLAVILAIYQRALQDGQLAAWVARLLVIVCVCAGIMEYRQALPPSALGEISNRPNWQREVAHWRSEPQRPLRTWPYSGMGSWWLRLHPRDREVSGTIELMTDDVLQLVATGRVVEHHFPIQQLPPDFVMVVELDSTRGDPVVDLSLKLIDSQGYPVGVIPIRGFSAGDRQRIFLTEGQLKSYLWPKLPTVRQVALSLRSVTRSPIRIRIYRLTLGPELDSLLERMWAKFVPPQDPGKSSG